MLIAQKRIMGSNSEAADRIVQEVVERRSKGLSKVHFSKVSVIKFICNVYLERIRTPQSMNNMISTIAYDFLMNRYGLKQVAERKLFQYFESCYSFLESSRVQLFARFNGLIFDSLPVQSVLQEEFNFYITLLKALDEKTNSGVSLLQNAHDQIFSNIVPFYLENHFFFTP